MALTLTVTQYIHINTGNCEKNIFAHLSRIGSQKRAITFQLIKPILILVLRLRLQKA